LKDKNSLYHLLESIDHKGYPNYKSTKGEYRFEQYILHIDRVQGDPFAAPSHLTIEVPGDIAGFPEEFRKIKHRRIALQDRLLRLFSFQTSKVNHPAKGSGKSGLIEVCRPGQEILERTDCEIDELNGSTYLRFKAGFPANGRTINSRALILMLFDLLPKCVSKALIYNKEIEYQVRSSVELADDQSAIRQKMKKMDLIAFVADGSLLPRVNGISQFPMSGAVLFQSPDPLRVEIDTPFSGKITGMGIRKGITLIVGGGYHGKSTLLKALERGVYDHIRGDGREFVMTEASAVKIRAEDGRSVHGTDISLFINNLPDGRDTSHFTTEDASGSTSQAANVAEAIEAGTQVLLIDEDTCATNFMIRDELMQKVVHGKDEPITPFISRIDQIKAAGISTILVAGSFGSYFNVSDTVIQMDRYRAFDITSKAKIEAKKYPSFEIAGLDYRKPSEKRIPNKSRKEFFGDRIKSKTLGLDGFSINHETVSLRYVEQIVDSDQNAALCKALIIAVERLTDGRKTLTEIVDELMKQLDKDGPKILFAGNKPEAGLAIPRRQEIFACLNRFRPLKI